MKKEQPKTSANFDCQDFESEVIQLLKDGEEVGDKEGVNQGLVRSEFGRGIGLAFIGKTWKSQEWQRTNAVEDQS